MDYWYKEEELKKDGIRAHHQVCADSKDGKELYVYLRVQFTPQPALPRMMFDFYGRTVCTYDEAQPSLFVVHAYDDVPAKNDVFEIYNELEGRTTLHFSFGSEKISDFSKEELMASNNPFAFAVLARSIF